MREGKCLKVLPLQVYGDLFDTLPRLVTSSIGLCVGLVGRPHSVEREVPTSGVDESDPGGRESLTCGVTRNFQDL